MANNYGPWATLIDIGGSLQLSSFWRRRLTMLAPTSRTNPVLSRRNLLWLGAAGLLTTILPTIHSAPAAAEEHKQEDVIKKPVSGRIYLYAYMNVKSKGTNSDQEMHAIIAIDPETGQWEKIIDNGHDPRVSPDGKSLVYSIFKDPDKDSKEHREIWNYDLKSKNKRLIYIDAGCYSWSPDGKNLVNTKGHKTADEKSEDDTRLLSIDGSKNTKLPIPETDEVDDWSRDGKWFVTVTNRKPPFGKGYQLYRMRPDGSEELRLTNDGLNCYPRFSHDSRQIVYLHQTAKDGNSLHVMDVDGQNDREIIREEGPAGVEAGCFSPDDRHLAVVQFTWQLRNGEKVLGDAKPEDNNWRIEIMDADGKNRRELKLPDTEIMWLGHPDWH
jgi:Tol biopolymer transport system component